MLRQKGFSERRAIAKIAADSKKMRLFPYREKSTYFPKGTERGRREAALRAHFQKLIASRRGRSLFDLFGSAPGDGLSFWERTLRDLDDGDHVRSLEEKLRLVKKPTSVLPSNILGENQLIAVKAGEKPTAV